MKKKFIYHLLIFFLPILINCSNTGSLSCSNPRESEAILESITEPKRGYLLQIGDVNDIKFYHDSKLNETVTVRPDEGEAVINRTGTKRKIELKGS